LETATGSSTLIGKWRKPGVERRQAERRDGQDSGMVCPTKAVAALMGGGSGGEPDGPIGYS